MEKGLFISFEGADGTGKTTQIERISSWLQKQGYEVVCTREPGGTKAAEKIRALVLDAELAISHKTETLLYLAARADHIKQLIEPALQAGKMVLCDRFSDSTFVYQGRGRGMDLQTLKMLDNFATGNLHPDLTILLDGDPEEMAVRRRERGISDRFELEGLAFQKKIREAFLELAAIEPERIHVINALQPVTVVADEIMGKLQSLLQK
ncbi:MAG: dTMP kinase [Negativicutes bacterium]|nr:dTMP kinase [Negativicutes bacterium]